MDLPRLFAAASRLMAGLGVALVIILVALIAALWPAGAQAAANCGPWNPSAAANCGPWNPSADPYRGDQAEAVMRLTEIPQDVRKQLADMVRQRYSGETVLVSRDGIVGGGDLTNLRSMNFGNGCICHGTVDRSTWPAGRHERATAYTVGRWSVLVFDSCRNVALATQGAALPEPAPYSPADVRAGWGGELQLWPPLLEMFRVPEPSTLWLLLAAVGGASLVRVLRLWRAEGAR